MRFGWLRRVGLALSLPLSLWFAACAQTTEPQCRCGPGLVCVNDRCVPGEGGVDAGMDAGPPSPDAGPPSPDAGPLPDTGTPPTDAGCGAAPCGALLYRLDPGATSWDATPLSEALTGAGAPAEVPATAWALCDHGQVCFGTDDRWHCSANLRSWNSGLWTAALPDAPGWRPLTHAMATPAGGPLPGRMWLDSGSRWWQVRYGEPSGSSYPLTLETHWMDDSVTPPRSDRDTEWAGAADAPRETDRIVADWLDVHPDASVTLNLLQDDGRRYRLFAAADGSTIAWQPPGPEPRLALPGGPPIDRVRAAMVDCGGTLTLVVGP